MAVLFTKCYGRVLIPGLSVIGPYLAYDIRQRSALAAARGLKTDLIWS